MYAGFSVLALIPARGGSKGLPNKNVLDCAGKPLIEWTIAAALGTREIDDVLVSTDAEGIAAVSQRAGASVPFLRPAEYATDESSMLDVVRHAWESHLDPKGARYDYVVLLQPTSPLRTAAHIRDAIKFYFSNRSSSEDTLASVCQVDPKYGWLMQTIDDSPYIRFCLDVQSGNPQRQRLSSYYLPNGAILIVKGSAVGGGFYHHRTIPFIMATSDSIDIDTNDDLMRATVLLFNKRRGAN